MISAILFNPSEKSFESVQLYSQSVFNIANKETTLLLATIGIVYVNLIMNLA